MVYETGEYFAQDGGLNYSAVLKHFREQVSGRQEPQFLQANPRTALEKRQHQMHDTLVLIDTAAKGMQGKKGLEDTPKITVVEPVEAVTKRAVGDLEQEARELRTSRPPPKRVVPPKRSHSSAVGGGRKTASKRKKAPAAAASAKTRIKRTKDIFD